MASGDPPITCAGCGVTLLEPYIKCAECPDIDVFFCLYCFAKGREVRRHKNSHKYEVMRNDFSVLAVGWTADDELKLLDAITHHGLGNWLDIGRKLKKSAVECERHYRRVYIENRSGHFEQLDDVSGESHLCPVVLRSTEALPRPAEGSSLQQDMSGYTPARGDFAIEFDNFAEIDLSQLDFHQEESGDADFEKKLKMAVVDIYRRVVRERYRRKLLVRDYGLINFRRHFIYDKKYHKTLGANVTDTLRVFGRHMTALEWDKMMEGFHRESLLRQEIERLCECRRQGITRLLSARIYEELKERREQEKHSRHLLDDALALLRKEQWLSQQTLLGRITNGIPSALPQLAKREMKPLDIVGLPNYDKLSDKEKEFCRAARFYPDMFLEHKRALVAENDKLGHVRLASARALLKIDVNKTRKMYDFLASDGTITKDLTGSKPQKNS